MKEPEPDKAEELCRQVAKIIGENSAAAKALQELEEKRKNGKIAWIVSSHNTWFVVSKPKQ